MASCCFFNSRQTFDITHLWKSPVKDFHFADSLSKNIATFFTVILNTVTYRSCEILWKYLHQHFILLCRNYSIELRCKSDTLNKLSEIFFFKKLVI